MKVKNRFNEDNFKEENQRHIDHKKKAINFQNKPRHDRLDEFGFDDEEEAQRYERFLK